MPEKKEYIIYDLVSFPRGLAWDVFEEMKEKRGLILWDSSNYTGKKPFEPRVINAREDYRLIDMSDMNEDERNELLKSIQ